MNPTQASHVTLEGMRAANQLVADVHGMLQDAIEPGVSTQRLDELAEEYIHDHGAEPAFKGYKGFPATLNTSLNEEVVHGIPSEDRIIRAGDLLSVDCGAELDGCFGDSAFSTIVGDAPPKTLRLLEDTRKALMNAIQQVQPGNKLGQVGQAIEDVAQEHSYGVVTKYCGHFIGHKMHLRPNVPNFGPPDRGPVLEPGMYLAIEPMFTLGTGDVRELEDGWTVVPTDGSLSCHWEHVAAVTEDGHEILSRRRNEFLL